MLRKVILTFASLDKTREFHHSRESYQVFSCDTVYLSLTTWFKSLYITVLCDHQVKVTEQYCHVVLFIMFFKYDFYCYCF